MWMTFTLSIIIAELISFRMIFENLSIEIFSACCVMNRTFIFEVCIYFAEYFTALCINLVPF